MNKLATIHHPPSTISLTEYQPERFPAERFSTRQAELIWQRHRSQVVIEPPSFKTQGQWQLTAQGWLGFLVVERDLTIALQPKVPLSNLFGMLAYAYELDEIRFENDLVSVDSLDGYLDRLAHHLVMLVRRQQQVGLYRSYAESTAALPFVRGQMDLNALWKSPPGNDIVCHFDELTADVLENQILVWTLHLLAAGAFCSGQTRSAVRRVLADLERAVSLRFCDQDDCARVHFHRLNRSYRPLIALCRFFLSGCEPSHRLGQEAALPFLINSATLFERFVARWLEEKLPGRFRLHVQERRAIGLGNRLHFAIDLTLYERSTGAACYVMDTKYKLPRSTPDTADIAQVVAYAEAIGAPEALLIYPAALAEPLDEQIGRIRVRSLAFDLSDELEDAGQAFLGALLD